MNPARDLAPRIAHFLLPIPGKGSSDWGYSWIPVAGSIIGAVLGSLFFKFVSSGSNSSASMAMIGLVVLLTFAIGYYHFKTKVSIQKSHQQDLASQE
jgi:glycerol uptake facilitator protein